MVSPKGTNTLLHFSFVITAHPKHAAFLRIVGLVFGAFGETITSKGNLNKWEQA